MPRLFIFRHGTAVPGMDLDSERTLTPSGEHEARCAGAWLAHILSSDARLVVSPYLRAQQTAQALATPFEVETWAELTPAGDPNAISDLLIEETRDVILVSHLPLVGRLASLLVDGRAMDQPWSPAEGWVLNGDIIAPGCMTVEQIWYPALENRYGEASNH